MVKRYLDCTASELAAYGKRELLESLAASEGRVLVSECIGITQPVLGDVTNAELAAAMGADMLLLNMFDVQRPVIGGLPEVEADETVRELKRLTGRKIGVNLEPVEEPDETGSAGTPWAMSAGRQATAENAAKAAAMGADFILLTGNPGNGVSNKAILDSLARISAACGERLVLAAGKMHASGVLTETADRIVTKEDVKQFVNAGADIVLLPAPGTVPGVTVEMVRELVAYAHRLGALTMTAIGTSQEGADADTVRRIALMCKMTGTDLHHIGDAGLPGIAVPENILTYSVAVRGVRHTYHRMAASVNR